MKIKLTSEFKNDWPYMAVYIKKYGEKVAEGIFEISLASTFLISAEFHHNPEELYKYCLEVNKQWTDVLSLPDGIPGKDYLL